MVCFYKPSHNKSKPSSIPQGYVEVVTGGRGALSGVTLSHAGNFYPGSSERQ